MGHIVIAAYRPKPDKEAALLSLTKTHVARLRALGLATDRKAIAMQASDGTVVEVFEWVSEEAVQRAHAHSEVLAMWEEYEACCTYVPVADVAGAADLFSGFRPLPSD